MQNRIIGDLSQRVHVGANDIADTPDFRVINEQIVDTLALAGLRQRLSWFIADRRDQ